MKKKLKNAVLIGLIMTAALLLLAGCSEALTSVGLDDQFVGGDEDAVQTDTPAEHGASSEAAASGGIRMAVPMYAPWVVTDKGEKQGLLAGGTLSDPDPAMLVATYIEVGLYNSSGFYDWTYSEDFCFLQSYLEFAAVPAGDYYVDVYVYNEFNPSGEQWTVFGSSGWFGHDGVNFTDVGVVCFPVSTTALTEAIGSDISTMNTDSEKWFTFVPSGDTTEVHCYSQMGDMDIYIFDPDGYYFANSSATTEYEHVTIPTVPGQTYYVTMSAYSGGAGAVGFVSYDSGTGGSSGGIGVWVQ